MKLAAVMIKTKNPEDSREIFSFQIFIKLCSTLDVKPITMFTACNTDRVLWCRK